MISKIRQKFNAEFTVEKYEAMLADIEQRYGKEVLFRVSETPIFIPEAFKEKLLRASEEILSTISRPDFLDLTSKAVPEEFATAGETSHPHVMCIDFAVCLDEKGELEPQLIEFQGFPSLMCWQVLCGNAYRKHFDIPENMSMYLNGMDEESYLSLLKETVLGKHAPENVILLEIKPLEQKTNIDFFATEEYLGVRAVCLTELIQEGNQLFYMRDGVKTRIHRIYNRLIFDDLQHYPGIKHIDIRQELDVEWCSHPNWFYRISKYSIPFLNSRYVPEAHFLMDVIDIPSDLENYVLKPLFSFAGQGVMIDVTLEDVESVPDPENWILQRKVTYADAIPTPDGISAKCEIRLLYLWPDDAKEPTLCLNLARMSKGKMIGTRYNKNFDWVGGTIGFFE